MKSEPTKSSSTNENNKSEAIFLPKPISCTGFYLFQNKPEQIKFELTSEEIKAFKSSEKYILKDSRVLYISATPIADGINNLIVSLGVHSKGDLFVWNGFSVTKTLDGSELSGIVGFDSDDLSFYCFSF